MIRATESAEASLALKNMHGSALNIRSTIQIVKNDPKAAIADLEASEGIFKEVVAESHDRFAEFQLAHVYRLLGKLRWKHADQDMAVSNLNQSRTLYEQLLTKPTTYDNIGSYCDLLLFLSQIMSEGGARLKDTSRIQQAEIAARRAVALLEAGPNNVPRAQMRLLYGQSLAALALAETRLNKYETAEGHFRKAIEVFGNAATASPKLYDTQLDMLQSQLNLACVLAQQNKVNESKIEFENCIRGFRKLAADNTPAVREYLANALQIHGRVLAEQNEIPAAKNAMAESVRLFEELSSENEAKRILPYLSRSRRHLRELEDGKALIDEPQIIK